MCKRLYLSNGQLHKKIQSTDFKITEMLKMAFEGASDKKITVKEFFFFINFRQ